MQTVEGRTKYILALATVVFVALRGWLQLQPVPTLSLPLVGLGFAAFLAIGLMAARGGIEGRRVVQWGLIATTATFFLHLALYALIAPSLPNPGSRFHLLTALLSLIQTFFTVGLPVAIGSSIVEQQKLRPKSAPGEPQPPREPIAPTVINAILVGCLPLLHIGLFLRGMPGRLDIPIYGIVFVTVPIGAAMAVVSVLLCAGLSKHGVVALLGTFFYGLGAILIFGALYLMGAKFSIPP